ncbi:hypothetical protein DPX16_7926 [Anabarilius grahami]|uniref:Uncharacterized protein n=1 Tax=Anabarilius grahami TaxID=495550 RepID=A0A3N0Z470_ANAGA|nr:hypothetical protein DPX16_7926 [Anabarilius grahami]
MQLAAAVNLASRLGTETPVAETPHNISVPLTTMSEVEELEEWLQDSRNERAKQKMDATSSLMVFAKVLSVSDSFTEVSRKSSSIADFFRGGDASGSVSAPVDVGSVA